MDILCVIRKSDEEPSLYSGVESIVQYKVCTYIHSPNCTLQSIM